MKSNLILLLVVCISVIYIINGNNYSPIIGLNTAIYNNDDKVHCPIGGSHFSAENVCVALVNKTGDIKEQLEHCKCLGSGNLASIHNRGKFDFLQSIINKAQAATKANIRARIGRYYNTTGTGTWTWTDLTSSSYNYYSSTNDSGLTATGPSHCNVMSTAVTNGWVPFACDNNPNVIELCQYTSNVGATFSCVTKHLVLRKLLGVINSGDAALCELGGTYYAEEKICAILINRTGNITDQLATCKCAGNGNLVSIKDRKKYDFLQTIVNNAHVAAQIPIRARIGRYYNTAVHKWVWTDRTNSEFDHYTLERDLPQNYGNNEDHCNLLSSVKTNGWNPYHCMEDSKVITFCQYFPNNFTTANC